LKDSASPTPTVRHSERSTLDDQAADRHGGPEDRVRAEHLWRLVLECSAGRGRERRDHDRRGAAIDGRSGALGANGTPLSGSGIRDFLYPVRNYAGASATITFDKNGDVIKPFAIKTIEAGGPKTILVK